jgi:hypothetical protein
MAVRRVVRAEDGCEETLALLKRGVAAALTSFERKDRDA